MDKDDEADDEFWHKLFKSDRIPSFLVTDSVLVSDDDDNEYEEDDNDDDKDANDDDVDHDVVTKCGEEVLV